MYNYGTVYELTPGLGNEWNESILYDFPTGELAGPFGGPVLDARGNIYGTTEYGGPYYPGGTVFELTPVSGAWDFTLLHSFGGPGDNACCPLASVILDKAGNLFGTAYAVFELTPGQDGWTETILPRPDGLGPSAGVIMDAAGNLYGTTEYGGTYNAGIVFELRPVTAGPQGSWSSRILHTFGSFPNDGKKTSLGQLVVDQHGNLYGATNQGGSNICIDVGCGTVFKLARVPVTPGGVWVETILYNFTSAAYGPGGGVTFDRAGNLYGTTIYGGGTGCGVVYELAAAQSGNWQYTLLHSFLGSDGCQPDANLTLGPDGNLYGTTATGGAGGAGVVFEIQLTR
jgi:uncharacterized repeat protein (TIGR03803 family)